MAMPYRGEIRWFAGEKVPDGWLLCDGQLVSTVDYDGLYGVIGNAFGGDTSRFALPDLRGRVAVGTGSDVSFAEVGGLEKVALSADEMPAHTHALAGSAADGDRADPAGSVWARSEALGFSGDPANASMNPGSLGNAGAGAAHENMMPFLALNPCISFTGLAPADENLEPDYYIGEIRTMAFPQVPASGWMATNAERLAAGFGPLEDLIGIRYGGTRGVDFALPDLQDRVAIHGSGVLLGNTGGKARHQLSLAELPIHSHTASAAAVPGDDPSPENRAWGVQTAGRAYGAAPDRSLRADVVAPAGGVMPHENRPPFLGLNHCIASQGVYPLPKNPDPIPEPYLGEVRAFAFPFAPFGWAMCDGSMMSRDEAGELLGVLKDNFGGDGVNTCALPNLTGRVPLGAGRAPDLTARDVGDSGGAALVTLEAQHLPSHTHAVRVRAASGGASSPEGNTFGEAQARAFSAGYSSAAPTVAMSAAAVGPAGDGQAHENMAPYLTVTFCIALIGLLP
jgi:microcystin-dependent protein